MTCSKSIESPVEDISVMSASADKDRICLYMKLCDLILLSMILQLELRVNKDH
jgi:hypothetical protein